MKISKTLLPAAALVALFASCQDEDFGYKASDLRYESEFQKTFGDVDPEQDWSMAQLITVNVSGGQDGILELYYSAPLAKTPIIIGRRKVNGGEGTFKFNIVKGTKQVYARIKDENGDYSINSYFNVVDNEVNISSGLTRALDLNASTSRVVRGEAKTLSCPQLLDWSKSDQFYLDHSEDLTTEAYINGQYKTVSGNQPVVWSDTYFTTGDFTNVIPLYNVLATDDERPWWFVSDIAPLFEPVDGEKACFKESENHIVLMKEGSVPHLEEDLVFEVKQAAPFYLDYFFKGTKYDNQFGYFYFTGANPTREQFMTMPKFVLIDNMSDENRKVTYSMTTPEGEEEPVAVTKTWNLLGTSSPVEGSTIGTGINGMSFATTNWDTKVWGTRIPLTYFGEDGTDATGTYNFPVGTKIGLFFIGNTDDNRVNKILTSIATLNRDLYDETPHAASFTLNGTVVFAMEDMNNGGDKDVNDAMFIVNAKIENPPVINPVEPESQTWIMACEDLGGTYDYDFNDLVFGLRFTELDDPTYGKLELIPLAAGGTLNAVVCYDGVEKGEIHKLLGDEETVVTTPINVTPGQSPEAGNALLLAYKIPTPDDFNTLAKKVTIKVTRGQSTTTNADDKGSGMYNIGYQYNAEKKAPQVLLLPPGWDWPSEEKTITTIYPGFVDWVKDGDVTDWCNTKADGASDYVTNPIKKAQSDQGGGEGGQGGEGEPVVLTDWNITVTGSGTMERNSSQTLEIAVEGLDDYSLVECGTYSTAVITSSKVDNTHYTINTVANTNGIARFYVLVQAKGTHKLTRKTFEIAVGDATPVFNIKVNGNVVEDGGAATITVNPTNANVPIEVSYDEGKADGNQIRWSSSNPDVVSVNSSNQMQRVGCGTTTITVTHLAVASTWTKVVKTFELTIARLTPDFTTSITECEIEEFETKQFNITNNSGIADAYSYESTAPTVATVSQNGLYGTITAVAPGEAIIKVKHAQTEFYAAAEKQIPVKIVASTKPEWNISISPELSKIGKGSTQVFTVSVENDSWEAMTVSVADESVLTASFTQNRQLTIVAGNELKSTTVSITLPRNDTHKQTTKTFTVEVVKPIPVFTLKANNAEVTSCQIYEGDALNFSIEGTTVASGVTYTCSTSASSVATVALNGTSGTITGKAAGTATITVTHPETTDYSETSKTIEVTVVEDNRPEWVIVVDPTPSAMKTGESKTFAVSVNGVQNTNDLSYSTNSLLTCSKEWPGVKVTAGSTTGEGKLYVSFPGDADHKTTTKTFTIDITAIVIKNYDLTGTTSDNALWTYTIPSEVVWSDVSKAEIYFEEANGLNCNLVGNGTAWNLVPGQYSDQTSNLTGRTSFQLGDQYGGARTISNVKLRISLK